MKKVIAILLMLTLAIQVIPVQEVGRLLWGGTMTEEITHEVHVKHYPAIKDALNYSLLLALSDISFSKNYILQDEALIKCLHLEVLIQPPNSTLLS